MKFRMAWMLISVSAIIIGCRHKEAASFPNWQPASASPEPSNPGFSAYCEAARLAESADPESLNRVSFTPGQRASAQQKIVPALKALAPGLRTRVVFQFLPLNPFEVRQYRRGWRLIGRALVWQIEDAVRAAKTKIAIQKCVQCMKFGFDLTGGGAADAALGLAIVDESRRAIMPSVGAADSEDLRFLSAGIANVIRNRPDMMTVAEHEKMNMLAAIQMVQDCYQKKDYRPLRDALGPDIREANEYLESLRSHDSDRRPKYFEGFAGEANMETSAFREAVKLAAADRKKLPDYDGETRPWKRYSRHFFQSLRPLLKLNDRTTARVRLLASHALIVSFLKQNKLAPKDLSIVPTDLCIDPYTGKKLIYAADGLDFKLYSVGENLQDDGGESDESGIQPDLVLDDGA